MITITLTVGQLVRKPDSGINESVVVTGLDMPLVRRPDGGRKTRRRE